MTDLIETSDWTEQIFQKEIDTPILGGLNGPANLQSIDIACRTQKIKDVLVENSICIDDADYVYRAQNIIFTTDFYVTVSDGDFVYWHEVEEKFYKAKTGVTEAQSEVAGMADVTNGRVIVEGLVSTNLTPTPGDKIYLSSTSGESTTNDTGISLGYYIKPGLMRLLLHYNFPVDPNANIPGLRTLGTTSQKACSGNDSRLEHTGDFTSDASGITVINDGVVTEAKQILMDNVTCDVSVTKHGYVPKGTNVGHFLKDDGTWDELIFVYIISRQDHILRKISGSPSIYKPIEEFTIPLDGNYVLKWEMGQVINSYAQICKNDVPINYYSTIIDGWQKFSVNLSGWSAGDLCRLDLSNSSTYIKNFRLCCINPLVGTTPRIYWDFVNKVASYES